MTDMTLPWPALRVAGAAREGGTGTGTGTGTGDVPEGVIDGVTGPDGGGVISGRPEGVTGDERVLPGGTRSAGDSAGRALRKLPAAAVATVSGMGSAVGSWTGSAVGSDILGGGPGGLIDHIRHPEPTPIGSHCDAIVNHPRKPGNEYLAVLFTGAQLSATLPVKIAGKTLQGIGSVGKRIDLAGSHPATIAIIAATAAAMILAIIYT